MEPKILGFDVGDLVRRIRHRGADPGGGPILKEAVSKEAMLRVIAHDNQFLDFFSTLGGSRLFSVEAVLSGSLELFTLGNEAAARRSS